MNYLEILNYFKQKNQGKMIDIYWNDKFYKLNIELINFKYKF